MGRALLVADQDMAHAFAVVVVTVLIHGIIDRQDRAAGIAEDHLDPLIDQGLDDDFRTGHAARGSGGGLRGGGVQGL